MYQNNNNIKTNNISPFIFTKKTNTNYKLVPFNVLVNDVGKTKYLPPVSKEWKNNVYNYHSNEIINLPVYDLNINYLIKGYFSLYLNHKFLGHKYISRRSKRKSFNRIFVSKAEIKHTNNKAIITLYVYNKERLSLLKKIRKLKKILVKINIYTIAEKWLQFITLFRVQALSGRIEDNLSLLFKYKVKNRLSYLNKTYFNRNLRFSKKIHKIFATIRRLRLRLSLNKYKFEEKFLYKLSQLISRYYGKKVEFNIVNLKSVAHNSDIFTEILTLKLKKEKSSPMYRINSLLSKIVLPKVNTIIERGRIEKQVDLELIDNKYRNMNINSIINKISVTEDAPALLSTATDNQGVYAQSYKDNLNKLLYNIYYKTIINLSSFNQNLDINVLSSLLNKAYYKKLRDIIFENIKYKNMGGARLTVKGRLTRRYRADRAVYKLKWKGGLKNIDSSFKGLSSVIHRGYLDSNVEKSKLTSKRRIGSFAVKGWFSGK